MSTEVREAVLPLVVALNRCHDAALEALAAGDAECCHETLRRVVTITTGAVAVHELDVEDGLLEDSE